MIRKNNVNSEHMKPEEWLKKREKSKRNKNLVFSIFFII